MIINGWRAPPQPQAPHHQDDDDDEQDEAADVFGQGWAFPSVWGMSQSNHTLAGLSSLSSTSSSSIIIIFITSWWPKRRWRCQLVRHSKKPLKCELYLGISAPSKSMYLFLHFLPHPNPFLSFLLFPNSFWHFSSSQILSYWHFCSFQIYLFGLFFSFKILIALPIWSFQIYQFLTFGLLSNPVLHFWSFQILIVSPAVSPWPPCPPRPPSQWTQRWRAGGEIGSHLTRKFTFDIFLCRQLLKVCFMNLKWWFLFFSFQGVNCQPISQPGDSFVIIFNVVLILLNPLSNVQAPLNALLSSSLHQSKAWRELKVNQSLWWYCWCCFWFLCWYCCWRSMFSGDDAVDVAFDSAADTAAYIQCSNIINNIKSSQSNCWVRL